ncbi:MAG: hypothetical protein A3I05_06060 [Deltaproteobacteria bacterium RIFCSPLOWO2_02_FULL_44_10]|nr:MAG: hypothetical protein A3C46_04045 [Deltaproteobacteria bacterium RIFCSPHIGHO2_02_FULL_44_16]OGQ45681.1 MAG: hypothetical protein A3I05_06060 [Deltaproteobacteria bacterium RIFCSPLOWO2_02_FULL_44_10]
MKIALCRSMQFIIILVLNYDKNGIKGYIGGNSFLEMGFAYIQKKPIYLLNEIPEIAFYDTEIKAMKPIVIYGELAPPPP